MRLLAVLCVLVGWHYSLCASPNNVECGSANLIFVESTLCVNTTLIDCSTVLVRATFDFDSDSIVDYDSGEQQVNEQERLCYGVALRAGDAECEVCVQFTDVDATGDGATFDPLITFSGGIAGACDRVPSLKLNQVQVGSDCNDYTTQDACFLADHPCGWCGATRTCESLNETDGLTPHCADCVEGWVLPSSAQPGTIGGGGDDNGSSAPARDANRSLALGLGIGIPLALLLVGCVFLVYRRNKKLSSTGGGGGDFDFERHAELSESTGRGTTILIPGGPGRD